MLERWPAEAAVSDTHTSASGVAWASFSAARCGAEGTDAARCVDGRFRAALKLGVMAGPDQSPR